MQFIDTHGHYAWGIDDGMPSLEEAKEALKLAKKITYKLSLLHHMSYLDRIKEKISWKYVRVSLI